MKIALGDAAFPYPEGEFHGAQGGLTKRELFAAMAMQGLCANHDIGVEFGGSYFAVTAVKQADALLTALREV